MSPRDYILNNFWLKLFSLVLATLVWFVIHTNFAQTETRPLQDPFRPDSVREFRRPIVLMTSAANRQVFQINPVEVIVKVRGETGVLEKLNPEEIQVFVKLMDVPNPQGFFRVEVSGPREAIIQQVSPANVLVTPLETE